MIKNKSIPIYRNKVGEAFRKTGDPEGAQLA